MENKNEIKISVRNLIEFILRSGSLDSRYIGLNRAIEGTKGHKKVQGLYKDGYEAEVPLKHTIEYEKYLITIEGRVDGILFEGDDIIIDEIKTVSHPIELIDENYNPLHWSQPKCYGYIYSLQKGISEIYIQLTYYKIDTEEMKQLRKRFTFEDLEKYFYYLLEEYCIWADFSCEWTHVRNKSIKDLQFPFGEYRKGQREMAIAVYKTIVNGKKLFAQAPTGIGKTVSTIFPAVKAIGEGKASKIFYLTAKTTTQGVAEETFLKMGNQGLQFKTVTITAKEKICFKDKCNCNPDYCEFAGGHFDRVNAAVMDMLRSENEWTREKILKYAQKHSVCPFEYSLDLSLWADSIICDYNYVFDPNASLKRFFMDKGGDYIFLIDEAHNLVDRSREMFSAELSKKPFLQLKKGMKEKDRTLYGLFTDINKYMINLRKRCEESGHIVTSEEEKDLYELLRNLITNIDEYLTKNRNSQDNEELVTLYFDVLMFMKISELFDETYVTFIEKISDDVKTKLYCLDPSKLISQALKKGTSTIFFSATLLPMDYFKQILGSGEDSGVIYLNSPFDIENRCLLIADNVSTRYVNRENSYSHIVEYINRVLESRKGNYMVFFPSYKYMDDVYQLFIKEYPDCNVNVQSPSMTEMERGNFLEFFKSDTDNTSIGFCVLGGVFSEGIDLIGDKLIGVIVVGVGLPQICLEREIIKQYYDNKNKLGFQYSYVYPGMNKVMQAVGRLIRSEADRGIVLLIDERFSLPSYQKLFPREWFPNIRVNENSISKALKDFWE